MNLKWPALLSSTLGGNSARIDIPQLRRESLHDQHFGKSGLRMALGLAVTIEARATLRDLISAAQTAGVEIDTAVTDWIDKQAMVIQLRDQELQLVKITSTGGVGGRSAPHMRTRKMGGLLPPPLLAFFALAPKAAPEERFIFFDERYFAEPGAEHALILHQGRIEMFEMYYINGGSNQRDPFRPPGSQKWVPNWSWSRPPDGVHEHTLFCLDGGNPESPAHQILGL